MSAQKISLASLSDLKSSTDDAIPQILTSATSTSTGAAAAAATAFTQQHYLANVRLALGYGALAIAGALFYADWTLAGGWAVTRPYTTPACVAYFAVNAALSYWIWAVERGAVFQGVHTTADGEQRELTLRSAVTKHDPTYRLQVVYRSRGKTARVYADTTVEGRFSQWFNMHGYLDRAALTRWLAEHVDAVREVGVGGSSGSSGAGSAGKEAAPASADTTSADVAKKGGKARKKR